MLSRKYGLARLGFICRTPSHSLLHLQRRKYSISDLNNDDTKYSYNLISELLKQFKQTSEVKQYIRFYGSAGKTRFAIIRISGDILHNPDHRLAIASSLSFLQRVGLTPIVVHGAGVFSGRRSSTVKRAGESGESKDILEAAVKYMVDSNLALVQELTSVGAKAVSFTNDFKLFENRENLINALQNNEIPIIAPIGNANNCYSSFCFSQSSQSKTLGNLVTYSTVSVIENLTRSIDPLKIISLRPEGGLRDKSGKLIGKIKVYDKKKDANINTLLNVDIEEYQHSLKMMQSLSTGGTIAITEPSRLGAELFTHKGDGTLITRGEQIMTISNLNDDRVDLEKIRHVLENSFKADLPRDYFKILNESLLKMYIPVSYRGLAIVTKEKNLAFPYLSKFAVTQAAQGDKLGEQVWEALIQGEPKFFWRSRISNGVNAWYFEQADGSAKNEKWVCFWRGVNIDNKFDFKNVEAVHKIPQTFI